MTAKQTIVQATLVAATILFTACQSDFVTTNSRPAQAVTPPIDRNSAEAEFLGTPQTVPLVAVGLPNDKTETAQVQTILAPLLGRNPSGTAPATTIQPTIQEPTPAVPSQTIDPITGRVNSP
ncbi:MAG TPA: hypothetical protein VHQ47_07590 [Phycisphaerae bacterium]|nr:hypothetical protein [Phycisphaerae bacterium]